MNSSTPSNDNAAGKAVIVLDVGTTNIKVAVITADSKVVFEQSKRTSTLSPAAGWQEQDPNEILRICQDLIAVAATHCAPDTPLGITNQRESVVAWDETTARALSNLILWSDKRTTDYCEAIRTPDLEQAIRAKTGLFLTPYSSAPKMHWLMQQDDVRSCTNLALGTLDSWLVFKLTGVFATDYTNASRTMLYNIQARQWDEELLRIFDINKDSLPSVLASKASYGSLTLPNSKSVEIQTVVGDQQASMYAAGSEAGTTKVTYGTGIFPMRILGSEFELRDNYLTTLAVGKNNEPIYALEGKVENAAVRVSAVYGKDQLAFDKLMLQLALEAAPVISGLIDTPAQIVYVDGGISQNNDILAEQQKRNHIRTVRLPHYNGAALGVAKLVFSTHEG